MKNDHTTPPTAVPFWAFTHLGKRIRLIDRLDVYDDGTFVYPIGTEGTLDGITVRSDGSAVALVIFDCLSQGSVKETVPVGDLVDIPFEMIRKVSDPDEKGAAPCENIPGRGGHLALAWMHGADLKQQLSKATFYRYRRELLGYGIDISRRAS